MPSTARLPTLVESCGSYLLSGPDGTRWTEAPVRDDLAYALGFLKRLNGLRTKDGRSIHDVSAVGPASGFSFFQQDLLWEHLRFFARLRPVLEELERHGLDEIETEGVDPREAAALRFAGVFARGAGFRPSWKGLLAYAGCYGLAWAASLWTCLSARLRGARVLVYTPDKLDPKRGCDFRFAAVYDALRRERAPFVEIFHTLLGKPFLSNLAARRRAAMYLEPFRVRRARSEHPEWDLEGFSALERRYASGLLRDAMVWAAQSRGLVERLRRLVRFSGVRLLLAVDDVRQTNELILACRAEGVRAVGIQHGHFTKYLAGWMNYGIPPERAAIFDVLYLWSPYWKNVLASYSSQYQAHTAIGGYLRPLPSYRLRPPRPVSSLSELRVLVVAEPLSNRPEVGAWIDALCDRGIRVWVSVRSDVAGDPLAYFCLKDPGRITVVRGADEALLNEIDVVAGTYSTYLNDLAALGKPAAVLETSLDHGHRLVEDGIALLIPRGQEERLLDAARHAPPEIARVPPGLPRIEDTISEELLSAGAMPGRTPAPR